MVFALDLVGQASLAQYPRDSLAGVGEHQHCHGGLDGVGVLVVVGAVAGGVVGRDGDLTVTLGGKFLNFLTEVIKCGLGMDFGILEDQERWLASELNGMEKGLKNFANRKEVKNA